MPRRGYRRVAQNRKNQGNDVVSESSNNQGLNNATVTAARLPAWLGAALSQTVGAFAGFASYVGWVQYTGTGLQIGTVVLISGTFAAIFGRMIFKLPAWWLPINFSFPPGLYIGVAGEWPGWIFGALFVTTVLVFWNVIRDRVPLYLSNDCTSDAVAEELRKLRPVEENIPTIDRQAPPPVGKFCDLGSGTGGFAVRVAVACPRWQVVGYESAPALVLLSILRASLRRRNSIAFVRRNFWNQNLGDFDAVYAFLSPEPMARLFEKVRREMKPGSVFISNSFDVPGVEPDEVVELPDRRKTRLLIWRF